MSSREFRFKRSYIIGAVVIIAGIIGFSVLANKGEDAAGPPRAEIVHQVRVLSVQPQTLTVSIPVTGRLRAVDRIELYSEVTGRLTEQATPFRAGNFFPAGSAIILIDDREVRYNLLSSRSQFLNSLTELISDLRIDYPDRSRVWEAYLRDFNLQAFLKPLPEPQSDRENYFIIARNIYNQFFSIQSLEARLTKHALIAPFPGVVTEALLSEGTLVRAGQKLGEFIRPGVFELETSVHLDDVPFVREGNRAYLVSEDVSGKWTGTVKRINPQVDEQTQTVRVFIGVNDRRLLNGMYLSGTLDSVPIANVISVPRRYLDADNRLMVVRDDALTWITADVVYKGKESAYIRPLPEGIFIVAEGVTGAYEGMKVQIVRQ